LGKKLTKCSGCGHKQIRLENVHKATLHNPTASNRLLTSDIVADGKDGANILEIAKLELTNTSPDVVVIELAMSALHLPLHTRIRIA
jgi:hypothetical protein